MWNEGRSWEYIFAELPHRSEGPSGCAVRQNSKSDLAQGPVVLELEEGPIASLMTGLLYRRRSNRQAAAMMTIQVMATMGILGRPSTSKHSRWLDLDEQRLLAYKKKGKSWVWIFGRFPGRTQRTRWNMVRPESSRFPLQMESKQLDPFASRETNVPSSTGI
jgi:hypothetical protein